MRRLNDEELQVLIDQCKYPPIKSAKHRTNLENRIVGGAYVMDRNKYSDTAAIMNADGTYRCSATFITQRHLVTAAHCIGGWWDGTSEEQY
ncbi:hypothetical protein AAVH_39936, partial [Aphelenchoides avenae]